MTRTNGHIDHFANGHETGDTCNLTMDQTIEAIQCFSLSKNYFTGIAFPIDGCDISVTIEVNFAPHICVHFGITINGQYLEYYDWLNDDAKKAYEDWATAPEQALRDPKFIGLVAQVARKYISENLNGLCGGKS